MKINYIKLELSAVIVEDILGRIARQNWHQTDFFGDSKDESTYRLTYATANNNAAPLQMLSPMHFIETFHSAKEIEKLILDKCFLRHMVNKSKIQLHYIRDTETDEIIDRCIISYPESCLLPYKLPVYARKLCNGFKLTTQELKDFTKAHSNSMDEIFEIETTNHIENLKNELGDLEKNGSEFFQFLLYTLTTK